MKIMLRLATRLTWRPRRRMRLKSGLRLGLRLRLGRRRLGGRRRGNRGSGHRWRSRRTRSRLHRRRVGQPRGLSTSHPGIQCRIRGSNLTAVEGGGQGRILAMPSPLPRPKAGDSASRGRHGGCFVRRSRWTLCRSRQAETSTQGGRMRNRAGRI